MAAHRAREAREQAEWQKAVDMALLELPRYIHHWKEPERPEHYILTSLGVDGVRRYWHRVPGREPEVSALTAREAVEFIAYDHMPLLLRDTLCHMETDAARGAKYSRVIDREQARRRGRK